MYQREDLIIIGAGGFAAEAYGWISDVRDDILGFYSFDDTRQFLMGERIYNSLGQFQGKEFIVAVGDPKLREHLWHLCEGLGLKPCYPIIHSRAVVGSPDCEIGLGSILCPGVVLTKGVFLGRGVIANLNSTVGHDSQIGEFSTLSPGVNISGNVKTGHSVYFGTNAAVRQELTIGSYAVIGMGAAVIKDVAPYQKVAGVPARPME